MKHFKKIITGYLAPELSRLRRERNLLLQDIAVMTKLPATTIDAIELGRVVAFHKYLKVLRFYRKEIKLVLVDEEKILRAGLQSRSSAAESA